MFGVSSAEAKGCLKGAAVGGTAGHFAGHHGFLGAAAGCVIGRHQANKAARQQQQQQPQTTGYAPNR
jgi:outer membrane lipoprotein SlyB